MSKSSDHRGKKRDDEESPAGDALRDDGMHRAIAHADETVRSWSEIAFAILCDFGASCATFRVEQVREYAEATWKLTPPPDPRAWGAVIKRAQHAQRCKPIGTTIQLNPKSHRGYCTLWRWL